jgi:hypothetical protein
LRRRESAVTINVCTGTHYSCGESRNWHTGDYTSSQIAQSRNNKTSFYLGDAEIILLSQQRNFSIEGSLSIDLNSEAFVMSDGEGAYFQCATEVETRQSSVSEDYEIITTTIHFIDRRHNCGVFTETKEKLTFSKSGSDKAQFNGAYSDIYYHKLKVTNAKIVTTTTYYVVVGGIKSVLKTVTETTYPYTAVSPLILVYPNPSSGETPMDSEIIQYGFYDYFGGGGSQIEEDGGDDYYYTDSMRMVGAANAAVDAAKAAERYATYFLGSETSYTNTESMPMPPVPTDPTPCASIAVDHGGRAFYSVTLAGQNFNYLEDGDLLKLLPYFSADPKFYPVGVI